MAVYEDGILYTDNSTLSKFQTCPTAAMMTYGYNLKPSDYRNNPAEAGTAIHRGMEVYMGGGTREESLEAFTVAYKPYATQYIPVGDRLAYDNVLLVFDSWLERNPIEEMPYNVKGPEFAEIAFNIPFVDGVNYVGMIDTIVERTDGLVLYVHDTKSTGNPDYKFRKQFDLGSQMTGYVWAAQQMFPDNIVAGIFISVVHVATVPTSRGKCKTHKGFLYEECGYMHPKHELIGPKLRSPQQLDDWERDAKSLAIQWRDLYLKNKDDVRLIENVPQTGKWVYQACAMCELSEFCRTGRNVDRGEKFVYQEWRPGGL